MRRVIASKTDMDSAYRRLHVHMESALSCITVVNNMGHILLRLPFGVSDAGGKFSIPSDIITDLSLQLAEDPSWNPNTTHSDMFD